MPGNLLAAALLLAQAFFGLRVLMRLARTAGGQRIGAATASPDQAGAVAVVVPVLNERARLGPCLDGLIAQRLELREILVSDGGSMDGTQALVQEYQERDARVRLVDASAIPPGWNGKAWGLECGRRAASSQARWILTMDADVRPAARLVASLLGHAGSVGLGVLSVATEQEVPSAGVALVHPALLATLVYRYGIPGHATDRVDDVQANGQCLLIDRKLLADVGGFAAVKASRCDDVTLARVLAATGEAVGFYESDGLVAARMHESARDAFVNWPRSLPLHDHLVRWPALVGLAEVTLVQALPLIVVTVLRERATAGPRWLWRLNVSLLLLRLGVLVGTARAYRQLPPTYWLSPLMDLPVALQLWRSVLTRRHRWRGRILVSGAAA